MKPSGKPTLARAVVLALMLVSYTDAYVCAAPRGGHVVSGTATIQQDGNLTIVTAGNRSIINYQSFNVGASETVRFVQPGADSSVLNRVLSPNPTNIFGQIQANGSVIIANPYGVFFQNGSVLNVGSIYAGAGRISNSDFTAGRIHFTDLAGDVRNDGVIAADNRIALMGANVVNNGTMTSARGMAMMVAGSEVYVGARNSNVFVQANGASAPAGASAAAGSIANHGTVAAPRVVLGAGDLYSTAIVNTGLLQGRSIAVNAGASGTAAIGGRLDASGAANAAKTGRGGSIQVLGGDIALKGAALDASGAAGGGSVRVGGDFHGGGTLARAAATSVDAGTTIKADATGASGDGGSVVLWSDQTTRFAGSISARGGSAGGNGGSAEVSSHDHLTYQGLSDLRAPAGQIGSLLLDPHNVTIADGASVVPSGGTTFGLPAPDADVTISTGALAAQLNLASTTLQANNDIVFSSGTVTASGGTSDLTLQAGRSITFGANTQLSILGALNATFNDHTALPQYRDMGAAVFNMAAGSRISAPGGVTIKGDTLAQYTGGPGTGIPVVVPPAIGTTVNANTGEITLQDISTIPATPASATTPIPTSGNITINNNATGVTGRGITVNGALLTSGATPNMANPDTAAGNITLTASGALGVNALTASGAGAGAGGGGTITLSGNAVAGSPAVTLGGAVAGGSLGVTARTTDVNGVVQPATPGETLLSNGAVTTSGSGGQVFDSAVALGVGSTLKAGAGPITFDSTVGSVTAPQPLTATTSGLTKFSAPVGGSSLTATVAPALANVSVGGPAEIDATSVTTTGNQSYGSLTLGGTGLTTLSSTGNNGSFSVGTITGAGHPLTVNGAKAAISTFAAINNIGALNFTLGLVTDLNGPITATSVNFVGSGVYEFSGGSVTTSAGQTYGGSSAEVHVLAPLTLSDTGKGNITLPDVASVFTSQPLTISTGGTTTFNGAVGALGGTTVALSSLTVGAAGAANLGGTAELSGGSITTTAAAGQVFNDKVTLGAATTLNAGAGPVTFAGTIANAGTAAYGLSVNSTGAISFGGAVGSTTSPLSSLVTSNTGAVSLNGGAVTTTGLQSYGGQVTLGTGAILQGGTLTLTGGLAGGGNDLTLNFSDAPGVTISATGTSAITGIKNFSSIGAGGTSISGAFSTTGSQNFGDALTLTGDTTLESPGGGAISFLTINSHAGDPATYALTVNTTGDTTFGGTVGGATPLSSLTTDGTAIAGTPFTPGGRTLFNPSGATAQVTTNTLGTGAGAQVYNDAVVLSKNTTLQSSLAGTALLGGPISFFGTVNGPGTLTLGTTGASTFHAAAGQGTALGSLSITGPATFAFTGALPATAATASIITSGAQLYGGAVTLGGNAALLSTGGNITFNQAIDGGYGLSVSAQGDETFGGLVGFGTPLLSLSTDAAGAAAGTAIFQSGGLVVRTAGTNGSDFQTYNDGVRLQQDATFQSGSLLVDPAATVGGNITFGGKVDGLTANGQSLTVNTAGVTAFNGLVGSQNSLRALTTDKESGTGEQTQFNMTLPATNNVAGVNVGTDGVAINDAVVFNVANSSSAKVPLNVSGVTGTNHPSVTSSGPQDYRNGITLQDNTVLQGTTLSFTGGLVGGGHDLTLDFSGTGVGVPGTIGTGNGIRNFASVGSGGTQLSGGTFQTTGYQYYGNAVTLTADTTLTSGNAGGANAGNIGFGGMVQGPFALTLNPAATGRAIFAGTVGGGTVGGSLLNLASLTVNGDARVATGGGFITTGGFQNYTGNLTLDVGTTLASTGGTVTVGSLAGNGSLQVTATGSTFGTINSGGALRFTLGTGAAIFNGPVAAVSLTTTDAGEVDLNGGSVTTTDGTAGQSYGGPVVLGTTAAGTLTTLTAGNAGPVTFLSSVGGSPATAAQNLTLNTTGVITLGGAVGSVTTPLASLTTTNTGEVDLNGGAVTTAAGGQSYGGAVVLGLAGGGLTTLLDTAGGGITFSKTVNGNINGTQALEVDTAGNETFTGLVGTLPNRLLSLATDANPAYRGGQARFGATGSAAAPSVATTGGQTYNDAVVLGGNTFLVGGNLTLGSTLDGGGHDLTLTFGGNVTVSNAFGSLNNFTSNGAGTTTIAGNFNTAGSQTYANATTLSANAILTGGGPISFAKTLNGGFTLSINTPGATTFGGLVGAAAPLASLTTDAPGSTAINGGGIATLGAQTYNDTVTLGANTLLASSNTAGDGGAVTFASTLDSNNSGAAFRLEIDTPGNEVFGKLVGNAAPLGSLITDANPATSGGTAQFNMDAGTANTGRGGVTVAGGVVTINDAATFNVANSTLAHPSLLTINNGSAGLGAQTYNGVVSLSQGTVLSSDFAAPATTGGSVTFNGTVDSTLPNAPQDLTVLAGAGMTVFAPGATINAAGLNIGGAQVTFNRPVGGTNPLNILTIGTNGSIAGFTPSLDINNGSITTTLGQTYTVPVILSADTTLTDANLHDIIFASTVNSDGTARSLTLGTGDTITFNGLVGNTSPLNLLSVNASHGTFFSMGLLGQAAGVAGVNAFGLTSTGPVIFGVAGSSLADLSHPTVQTVDAQTYNGTVTLALDTSLYAQGAGNITFNNTVDALAAGGAGLTLNAMSDEVFNGLVGSGQALMSLATDNAVVGGQAQFAMNVAGQAGRAGVRVGAGGVTIGDQAVFGMTGSTLTNPSLLVFGNGTQTYKQPVSLSADTVLVGDSSLTQPSGSLKYDGGGAVLFGAGVFNTVQGLTPSLTIRTGTGPAFFQNTVNVASLDVTGALVTFTGPVAGLNVLSILPNGGGIGGPIHLNGGITSGNTVTTSAGQTYGSAVVLGADTNLLNLGTGQITFNSTLDGPYNLNFDSMGGTVFNGAVGGQTALQSLASQGAGTVYLNGGSVTTASTGPNGFAQQLYQGPVVLGADTVLTNTSTTPGRIFLGTVDSDADATPRALSVNADQIAFNNAVGGLHPLLSLTATGSGLAQIGGNVTTAKFQSYGSLGGTAIVNPVTLQAGQGVTFLTALQGAATSPDSSLTINAGGQVRFASTVGGPAPLTSLTVNAGSILLDGGSILTSLAQTYNGPVLLGVANTLQSAGNGGIVFDATLDGAFDLAVNTGGVTAFNGKVGGTAALTNLTTDNRGQVGEGTQFNMDAATAAANPGGVNVAGQVTINDAALFNVLNSSLAHPGVLTLDGPQVYGGAATLARDTVLTATGGKRLVFNSTVDGTFNLALNTTGATVFNGLVGGTAALASVTTDAGGTTAINGGGVTAAGGAQTYNDAVLLGADTTLASGGGGNLLFNSTVDGDGLALRALTLNTAGQVIFRNPVGGTAALASLTSTAGATQFNLAVGTARAGVLVNGPVVVNGTAVFNLTGSSLTQPGVLTLGNAAQTYNGLVQLAAADTVLVSASALPAAGAAFAGGGGIAFTSPQGIVSTGGSNLFVRSGVGALTFGAAVNVGSLDLGGAQVTFLGPVTLPGLLSVEPNGGGTGGTIIFNGPGLTTAGAQVYNAAVIIGANTILTSLNTLADGGGIVFNSTVDGNGLAPWSLTLDTPGDEVFNGVVGGNNALGSLATDATGIVGGAARFNMNVAGLPSGVAGVNVSGAVTINDGVFFNVAGGSLANPSVQTGGAQTYNGAASLSRDTVLTSTGGGLLTFNSTLDGGSALILNSSGDEVFNGVVGGTTALASLTTDAAGTARFNMTLAGLPAGVAGVNVVGAVLVNDAVVFNVAGSSLANPGILTGGAQTYNGAATLALDTVLAGRGDAITFNSTLDGGRALVLSTPGDEVFNGIVGGTAALASLTTDGAGAVGGTARFNMTLTGNSPGVTIAGALTVNDAAIINVAGSTQAVPSILTGGTQTYNGAATLLRSTNLTSNGGGTLNFNSTLDGGEALTLNTSGDEVFNGIVGGTAALASLTTNGGTTRFNMSLVNASGAPAGVQVSGALTLNSAAVFNVAGSSSARPSVLAGGAQVYNGVAFLARNTVLASNGSSLITFNSTLDGGKSLILNTAGDEVFNGVVGGTTALSGLTTDAAGTGGGTARFNMNAAGLPAGVAGVNVAGALVLNDAVAFNVAGSTSANPAVQTGGGQTYNGAATLLRDTVLTGSTGGDLVFNATVDQAGSGAQGLTLNTAGDEVFNGVVGGTNALTNLITDAAGTAGGTVRFSMNTAGLPAGVAGVNVANSLVANDRAAFNVASSTPRNPTILTGGTQIYNGAATLLRNAVLTSTNGGALIFNSTLDGGSALVLDTAGDEIFNGLVGGTTALASLTTDATGAVGGAARFNMTLAGASAGVNVAGDVAINDAAVFNVAGGNQTTPSIRSGGAQTYNGAAALSQDTVLASTAGGTLTFNSTLDGSSALTLNSSGDEVFNGVVGYKAALTSLTTDAAGTAGGATRFNMTLGDVPVGVTLTGALMLNDAAVFNVAGSAPSFPSILTGGAQTYNGAITLVRDAALTSRGGGTVAFHSTLDGSGALTLNTAGDQVFDDIVGGTSALASLSTSGGTVRFNMNLAGRPGLPAGVQVAGAVTLNSAVAFNIAGASSVQPGVLAGGTQTYNGTVTLIQDTVLASNNVGSLVFNAPVDGAHLLMLNTGGQTVFNQAVGSLTALLGVITDGPGTTRLNGRTVATSGSQTYGDSVLLGAGTTLTSQNTAGDGGAITLAKKADGGFALKLNTSGNIVLGGVVGGTTPLSSLRTDGGGLTQINGRQITTTSFQTYNNAVQLGADTTLTSQNTGANGGAISFNNALNGAFALTVNTGDTTLFNGAVGVTNPLASLTTDAPGTTIFANGSVRTGGAQSYGDVVQLRVNTTLTSTQGGGIAFNNTLDGAYALTVSAGGETRFGGLVGGTVPLVSLAVSDTVGTTVFGGGGATTTGFQTYGNALTLGADTTLTSRNTANDNGAITFNGTLDGARALTLNTSGQTVFNAAVGARTALFSVTTDAPGSTVFNAGSVQTADAQTYNDAATLAAARSVFGSTGGTVVFAQTVDAAAANANALELDTSGGGFLNGNVGAGTPVAELLVNGALTFGGATLTSSGNQHYAGGLTANPLAGPDSRLVSNTGTLRFDQAVLGGGGLTMRANRIVAAGDVASAGDLSLNTVGGTLSPLLLLNGRNYTSTGGNVLFNTQGTTPDIADDRATIVLSNTGTVTVRGANFTMGYLQKIFSLGTLDIEVGRGVATIGDIAARDSIRIAASQVNLLARPTGTSSAAGRPNDGLNFVADDAIDFGAARIVFVGTENPAANFITAAGNTTIQRVVGISLFKDQDVDSQFRTTADFSADNFQLVSNPLQPVGGGSQALDTAAALSGALPDQKPIDVSVDITISASQMEELKKLGIHPRLAQKAERGSSSKRALFAQLVDGQDPDNYGRLQPIKGGVSRLEPSDYVVVVDRMGEREVQSILTSFENLYGKDKEKVAEIGGAYQTAFNDYTVEKQTADPAGFAPYLEANPGKYPAVDSSTRGFDDLFGHIEHLGLTDKEVAKSEEHIASDLSVSGVSPEDMVKVINSQRKKLPLAQKAPSTKAPKSAPAANPAPGATAPAPAPGTAAPAPAAPAATPAPTKKKEEPLKTVRHKKAPKVDRHAEVAGL